MHKIRESRDRAVFGREAAWGPPFGPGFSEGEVERADAFEVWGSDFSEPGPDYVEYRLLREGSVVAKRRTNGY